MNDHSQLCASHAGYQCDCSPVQSGSVSYGSDELSTLRTALARAEEQIKELESERDEWDRKEDSWKHAAIKQQHRAEAAEAKNAELAKEILRLDEVIRQLHSEVEDARAAQEKR